ncbi:MAG: transglycosylase domain-containing protein [Bacillota bacterium]
MNRRIILIALMTISLTLLVLAGCSVQPAPKPQVPQATRIFDVNGQLVASLFQENRVTIPLKDIPVDLRKAVVAIEDTRFYEHHGVDIFGLGRAVYLNLKAGKVVAGGSTITQQLAKNLYLTQKRTLGRKIKELVLAIDLERSYSKDEILEMYLNQIFFGNGAYGVEVAAQTYFAKPAMDLDLAESALLAGLIRSPANYAPFRHPDRAKLRQKLVLERMAELGMITREKEQVAVSEPLKFAAGDTVKNNHAPFFVDSVVGEISTLLGDSEEILYRDGLSIYTTLNLDMQKAAEASLSDGLSGFDPNLEGALVAIDPSNGHVRAMVGGRDYNKSRFNRATSNNRQPGSAMKPYLYTAALSNGYTQASVIKCEPVSYILPSGEVYQPADYGNVPYHNRYLTLHEAVMISDNVVAVRLNSQLGPQQMVDFGRVMGIQSKLSPFLSLPLGTIGVSPLEMADAYSTLVHDGIRVRPVMILKVVDQNGRILWQSQPDMEQVIDQRVAFLVTDMLRAVMQPGGTGGHLAGIIQRPSAGKTGTTQNQTDAWFVGFTPDLVTSVYVGFDDPSKSVGHPGGRVAGPIWANFMYEALKDTPPRDFAISPGVVQEMICSDSGLVACPSCPSPVLMSFIDGTQPLAECNDQQQLNTDQNKSSNFMQDNFNVWEWLRDAVHILKMETGS